MEKEKQTSDATQTPANSEFMGKIESKILTDKEREELVNSCKNEFDTFIKKGGLKGAVVKKFLRLCKRMEFYLYSEDKKILVLIKLYDGDGECILEKTQDLTKIFVSKHKDKHEKLLTLFEGKYEKITLNYKI